MVKNKKVSVIIPTFKRNDSLKKSIKSVLSQTYENFEIIVVDDNYEVQYSENVNKIIDELNDNRIIYLKAEEHINGAAARNYGFNRSSGEMICFLDDDDEFYADKLLEQVNCLSTIDKAYGATACLWNRYEKDKMVDKGVLYTEEQMHRRVLSMDVKILLPTVMFKRSELEKTKLFDVSLKRHQDVQLFFRFSFCKQYLCNGQDVSKNKY